MQENTEETKIKAKLTDLKYDWMVHYYSIKHSPLFKMSGLFITLMGIAAGTYLAGRTQLFQKEAAGTNVALSFPATLSARLGETFTVPVMLYTDNHVVSSVDVEINFDHNYLQLVSLTPRSDTSPLKTFLPQVNGAFDNASTISNANSTGKLKFGAISFANGAPTTGFNGTLGPTNPLMVLTFKALRTTSLTNLNFAYNGTSNTDSNVMGSSESADILSKVQNAAIAIASPTPTASPATPTFTVTPTKSVTLTPTRAATATPTRAVATLTPTKALTPSPVPTTADTTKPSVSWVYPADGASLKVNSQVTLEAKASDNVGVEKVQFYVNGSWVHVELNTPYTYTWTVPAPAGETVTLMARALDAAGNATSSTIAIRTTN